jgi:8-oxo-dGTP pyrophosphatase MutT (NUDIX family)
VPDEIVAAPPRPALRHRPTSRVLVVDAQGRLLLLRIEDPRLTHPRFWITPGGGVDPGESFEDGARRELWEETGIVAPLGPCVWTRRRVVSFEGELLDFDERFYVVRIEGAPVISSANVTAEERIVLTAHRWWTADELLRTEEVLAPRKLAHLVGPILAGRYPPEPLILTEL